MKDDQLIAEFHRRLEYSPETGVMKWRITGNNYVKPGDAAGSVNSDGYIKVHFFEKTYGAHQIAWAMTHGYFPEQIDHINGRPGDNRLCNLRSVNQSGNSRNTKLREDNSSGLPGVHWSSVRSKWIARITDCGRRIALGYHHDFFEAVCARKAAELKHDYHVNHGRTL